MLREMGSGGAPTLQGCGEIIFLVDNCFANLILDIDMRILLVEDDSQLGAGISAALTQAGYAVDWLKDGAGVKQALTTEGFDVMVLDLGLPNADGLSLLKNIRESNISLPVLILTARDSIHDRVAGLDQGADDYMVKPFDLDELHARLRALIRRQAGRASPTIQYGDITLDPAAHTVTHNGKFVSLASREFAVLHLLLENIGRVMSREQIEEHLYGWNDSVESNATEVHIHHLRKKLGKQIILTVRGVGYMVPKPLSQTSP